jgi:hypothetical protein
VDYSKAAYPMERPRRSSSSCLFNVVASNPRERERKRKRDTLEAGGEDLLGGSKCMMVKQGRERWTKVIMRGQLFKQDEHIFALKVQDAFGQCV